MTEEGFIFILIEFLLSVANSAGFADYCDLDLSRVGHFILDTFRDVVRQLFCFLVIHFISANNYTEFATRPAWMA